MSDARWRAGARGQPAQLAERRRRRRPRSGRAAGSRARACSRAGPARRSGRGRRRGRTPRCDLRSGGRARAAAGTSSSCPRRWRRRARCARAAPRRSGRRARWCPGNAWSVRRGGEGVRFPRRPRVCHPVAGGAAPSAASQARRTSDELPHADPSAGVRLTRRSLGSIGVARCHSRSVACALPSRPSTRSPREVAGRARAVLGRGGSVLHARDDPGAAHRPLVDHGVLHRARDRDDDLGRAPPRARRPACGRGRGRRAPRGCRRPAAQRVARRVVLRDGRPHRSRRITRTRT